MTTDYDQLLSLCTLDNSSAHSLIENGLVHIGD